jgi:hypothetical protein
MQREENMLKVTRRLILMTAAALLAISLLFAASLWGGLHFMISWACFGCGLVGGFISIQQRLKHVSNTELSLLAKSWFQISLVPIYGALFALILYVGFLGQIVTGPLFPRFYIPAFSKPPVSDDLVKFFRETSPATGADAAKLLFWCLIAGFSERLIPQIISHTSSDATEKKAD